MSKKRLSEKEKDKLYETYKIGRGGSSLIMSLFGPIALIAVFNLIHLENQPCGSTCFDYNIQVIGIIFVLFISGFIALGFFVFVWYTYGNFTAKVREGVHKEKKSIGEKGI